MTMLAQGVARLRDQLEGKEEGLRKDKKKFNACVDAVYYLEKAEYLIRHYGLE